MTTPQTGFEQSGEWTTLAQETDLLNQVTAETSAVLSEAGRTVQGTPIHRVDLGTGVENTMLIVSLQHADEQASREGALQQIRDLAYSSDPSVLAYLAEHRIVWLTNVNADMFPHTRNNANNFNINRDHYLISQPETHAIVETIRDTVPHLIVDAHEFFAPAITTNYLSRGNGLPGTHEAVQSLGYAINEYCKGLARDQGMTAADYFWRDTARTFLTCAAGAHHAVGFLSETNAIADTPAQRVATQRLILEGIREWHEANADACTQARDESRQWAIDHTGDDQFYVRGEFLGREPVETVRLAGYHLTSPLPQKHIDAFGIEVGRDGFVSLNQEARLFLPQLLDPDSMDKQAEAIRVPRPPEPEPSTPLPDGELVGLRVKAQGATHRIVRARHLSGGVIRDVWVP